MTVSDKLVFIVVESSAEPDVMATLAEMDLRHYTRWTDVSGSGETGRKEGNPIFPGLNTVLMVVMPANRVEELVERLHAVRAGFIVRPGMKIIVTDCVMY